MNSFFDLSGKKAIVTGGGSGIGEAIAKTLAAKGADVYILDLNQPVLDDDLNEKGDISFIKCDVSNGVSVQKAFSSIGDELDILINNAGIAHIGNVDSTSEEDFDRIYNVNVKGVYHCLKAAIPMMKANGGSIINISSVAAVVAVKDRFAYSMSKGAVHTMTLSVAKDYIEYNIRCNSIAPGRIHTPFVDGFLAKNYPGQEKEMFEKLSKTQPIGRMGNPAEVAALVLYLVSDEAAFITGTSYPIDGGFITLNT